MVPFSEREDGFFPTDGVASFPDCSKPTFYGTLEDASRMGGFSTSIGIGMGKRDIGATLEWLAGGVQRGQLS
jgi:hypothetical protein